MTLKDHLHLGHGHNNTETTADGHTSNLGSVSSSSNNEVIPKDNGDVAVTLEERLRAWKHLVANLQDYVEQTESVHKNLGREYEKVVKTIAEPLKQSEMYNQATGGVESLFENLRTNTQALAASHTETEKLLKNSVVPQLDKLHSEIKAKQKDLTSAAHKGAKSVSKSREHTKKHVDELAKFVGHFDSAGATRLNDPVDDPYVARREVMNRLHKQVTEENSYRQELLGVQSSMMAFEAHIIQTIQAAMNGFHQAVSGQAERTKALYADIAGAAQRIPPDYEWQGFVQRFGHILIDPKSSNRSADAITFPNQDHKSTKPVIEGVLQRKGKIIRSYSNGYYVVTPSKYLHQFTDGDFQKAPEPELSLYLPECALGALSQPPEAKFNVSGKDANKNQKLTREHEFCFKCKSHEEAKAWYEAIASCIGIKNDESPMPSPTSSRVGTFASIDGEVKNNPTSPTEAAPPATGPAQQEVGITKA